MGSVVLCRLPQRSASIHRWRRCSGTVTVLAALAPATVSAAAVRKRNAAVMRHGRSEEGMGGIDEIY